MLRIVLRHDRWQQRVTSTSVVSPHQVVRILDVEPDLGADLAPAEFAAARAIVSAPLAEVPPGTWTPEELSAHPAVRGRLFGCIVVHGLVVRELLLAGRATTHLFGPGDLIGAGAPAQPSLPLSVRFLVPEHAGVALLDDRFLAACRRWPRLTSRLTGLAAAQLERSAVHQAISQLPRAEDRLLALFWHLADRWGQVNGDGVVIDLLLTHEALGHLIGARRPTVSLALRELAGSGALTRRENGSWLLLASSLAALDGDAPGLATVMAGLRAEGGDRCCS